MIDNKSAVQVAQNPEHHGRMKYLDLKFFWLRDMVEANVLAIQHLPGVDNLADIFTKPLPCPTVMDLVEQIGLKE